MLRKQTDEQAYLYTEIAPTTLLNSDCFKGEKYGKRDSIVLYTSIFQDRNRADFLRQLHSVQVTGRLEEIRNNFIEFS